MAGYSKKNTLQREQGSHALQRWLQTDTTRVFDTARAFLQAERIIAQEIPGALGQQCKVASLEGQQMRLAVPSPAHAAKARQLAPTLTRALQAAGWDVHSISVQVQAALYRPPVRKQPRAVVPIDTTGVEAFATLAQQLPKDDALTKAINKLVQRHRPKQ
ncbi:MAG TPA: DUF721 domain-containing protein [Candidatus Paenalcaligenes intestinipullorum]|uniref:DUF721 domain-containing protein n=1 Tax=Candidatus Paenalcaligenes intestinipullorum TaxID=2838718 RepID=A0A9D2RFR5_9BURK|nr:DUF721 domain-containing protein [Candidatus Paenalcaligenes intestinipullorum]